MGATFDLAWCGGLGFAAGFLASIPGGPVNATLLADGPRRGLRWSLFLGLGAVAMETAYCTIAFAGFTGLFDNRWVRAAMELASFLLLLWLGVKYLRGVPLPGEERLEHFVEERFHPHTALWTGFLRVLGNPGILLWWLTIAATLLSRGWLADHWECKWAFVLGVAGGGLAWFSLVSWLVTHASRRATGTALARLHRLTGAVLIGLALVVGIRLVEHLARTPRPVSPLP